MTYDQQQLFDDEMREEAELNLAQEREEIVLDGSEFETV